MADFRVIIPQLIAMHNAGVIKVPTVKAASIDATVPPGDLDTGTLSGILRFYEQNRGLFSILLSLWPTIQGLFHGGKPVAVPAGPVVPGIPVVVPVVIPAVPPPLPGPPKDVVLPPVSAEREIAALNVRYFWINRKVHPYTEGGGRSLLSAAQFQGVLSRADPLQAGDRVTFDITPIDQFGREFRTGDDANKLMKDIEHWVVGGVGELQLQDPEGLGFDPTPTLFVPWEKDSGVVPGFQGELGYYCTYTSPKTGAEIRSNELPNLRIRPWA